MIRLTVKDGSIVQTLTLTDDKVFLGRLESNTIRLTSDSVSRKHGLIRRSDTGRLEILDLNSRHGIRRNGESVDRASLSVGDVLELGTVKIRVEALEGAPEDVATLYRLAPPEREGDGEKVPAPAGDKDSTPARERKELISQAHRSSFNEELFRQLRRTPWWAASSFIHILAVYLFALVPFATSESGSPFGTVSGDIAEDFGSVLDDVLGPEDFLERLTPEVEDAPAATLDEDAPALPSEELEAFLDDLSMLPELGPAAADFRTRLASRDLKSNLSIRDADFGQTGAAGANREAVGYLKRSLGGRGGGSLGLLKRLTRHDVLVVEGHYDKVETILDLLDLSYETTTVRRLDRTGLDGRKVVFINCSNEAPTRETLTRIRSYVQRGGYLLTTDWGLENVVRKAFEGTIRPLARRGRNLITPNEVIGIHAVPEKRDHFLLAGTRLGQGEAKWWLEESSYPIEVVSPERVEVLIESDDLQKKYGSRPVAVTFTHGKGRILHMMGHFFQKEGNIKGAFSTQRLIANFLIAAVRKR